METETFLQYAYPIGAVLILAAHIYFTPKYLRKIGKEDFDKVFGDKTEEEKTKAKAIMSFIENNH